MSIKTTLKEIKNAYGVDVTKYSNQQLDELRTKEKGFDEIAWSGGVYGCNGVLVRGRESGELYKVTARTNAIYIIH